MIFWFLNPLLEILSNYHKIFQFPGELYRIPESLFMNFEIIIIISIKSNCFKAIQKENSIFKLSYSIFLNGTAQHAMIEKLQSEVKEKRFKKLKKMIETRKDALLSGKSFRNFQLEY